MRAFSRLLDGLSYTQSRNRKMALLAQYFHATPDPDRGWALAALTDGIPLRLPLRRMLGELAGRFIDPVLYRLSRDYVGDTAETVALLWPENGIDISDFRNAMPRPADAQIALQFDNPAASSPEACPVSGTLSNVIALLSEGTTPERTQRLCELLNALDTTGRWALLKLLGGAPRVGVSARLARTGLAAAYGRSVTEIEEIWHALTPPYLDLFDWLEGKTERPDPGAHPVFRPVMLAHPIEAEDWPRLQPQDVVAEWKWDGIRVQIAARHGEVRMFSRHGDDISGSFPEIHAAFLGRTCVVDGELLVMRGSEVAPFNELQQRLNRKVVTPKMLHAYPAHVRLYDLLLEGEEDLRGLAFAERRARLEAWHAREAPSLTDVSPLVPFSTFSELGELWAGTRAEGVEGLMLKRRDAPYLAGRVKGQWFKWKRAALTLDCVLMYAQRGSGKRSSYYSDYTFGVWREENGARELVPVGKAYSGFTDEELLRLDHWIRTHTADSFGPVRAVAPGLVFEVAFEAVQASTRHKSGVAMRFPRIHRIRWDKPAADADSLATILALARGGTEDGSPARR